MKKRLITACLMLIFMTLLFSAALTEGGEQFKLHSYTDGKLIYDALFLNPSTGPGYQYMPVSCSAREGTTIRVLTKAVDRHGNTWVLCEVSGKRMYLLQSDGKNTYITADLSKIPKEPAEQLSEWQCMAYGTPELRYGPGEDYPEIGRKMNDDPSWVVLMNGDWALVEQTNAYDSESPYFIRGWVKFSELIY